MSYAGKCPKCDAPYYGDPFSCSECGEGFRDVLPPQESQSRIEVLEAALMRIANDGIGYGEVPERLATIARHALWPELDLSRRQD